MAMHLRRGSVLLTCTPCTLSAKPWFWLQASFTAKELRELLGFQDVRVAISADQLAALTPEDVAILKASRARKRVYDIMAQAAASPR